MGDVEVTELRGRTLRDYRRCTVGIVFQAFNLVPSLTARENVEAPLRAAGVSGRSARARASELLERFVLDDRSTVTGHSVTDFRTRVRPGSTNDVEAEVTTP